MKRSGHRSVVAGLIALVRWLDIPSVAPAHAANLAPETRDAEQREATVEGEAPKPVAPIIVPPRPLHVPVTYPAGARSDEAVYLEFVVTDRGRVSGVRVLSGREPFASAAASAALGWTFQPATRAGRAVSVRIRFRVDYREVTEETAAESAPEPGASSLSSGAPAGPTSRASPDEPIEVVVQAERRPEALTLTTAEARELPGTFGDPTRAIEILPGVTPLVSALPLFFVRGAPPGNVGFFIDGVPVPLLYHAFLGVSVIHPSITERVDFYRGPYPAQYGRYAGSVAALATAEPRGTLRGEATLRLSDGGAFLEVPVFGDKGSVLLAGRYSFSSLLISQFVDGALEYWDYQTLGTYELDDQNRLGLFVFGAFDFCKDLCSEEEDTSFSNSTGESGVEFHRVDARFDHAYRRGRARVALTGGFDRTRGGLGFDATALLGQARVEHEHRYAEGIAQRSGADLLLRRYEVGEIPFSGNVDDIRDLFFGRDERLIGAHSELAYSPTARVTLTPAVRADVYQSGDDTAIGIDPRLVVGFQLTKSWRALTEIGLSHQLPNYVPNVPGVQVAGIPAGLQKALHSSGGFVHQLPERLTLSYSVFNNVYYDLTDPFGVTQSFELDAVTARRSLRGVSQGLEVLLRRPLTRRLGGIISYTLSRTTRTLREFPQLDTLAGYDRTHVLNTALTYEPFARWRFGVRTVLYSGIPGSRATIDGPVFDQPRGPAFFRLDWRVQHTGRFGSWGDWAVFAEVLNSTFSREVIRRPCNTTGTICNETVVGPLVLPNLGFELRY